MTKVCKMRAAKRAARILFVSTVLCAAIPSLGQIPSPNINSLASGTNVASLSFAQGSIVSIYGQYLGSALIPAGTLPLTAALPNDPTGTSVQISAAGVVYNAWILYA